MKRLFPFIVILSLLIACNNAQQTFIPTLTPFKISSADDATRVSALALTASTDMTQVTEDNSTVLTLVAVEHPLIATLRATTTLIAIHTISESTPTPTTDPNAWKKLPVIPTSVSQRAKDIYAEGQKLGNQSNVFTLVGDCDATPTWFLGDFDLGPKHYNLGSYTNLQDEIDYFKGSFGHQSLAVRRGFVAASVLAPLWADPKQCKKGETPLSCEVRISKPAFAFILLGTNDYNHREAFEPNMRKILDGLIANGVLPILGTKADNMEKDYSLNASIARLAAEYELPLWNFWAATDPLPAHGLDNDLTHLTWASNDFSDPTKMKSAWPWRNLTALQTLEVVWNAVK